MGDNISPQPFDQFIESVASADYEEVRRFPGSAVDNVYAFAEMKEYLLDRYKGVDPVDSVVGSDGQVIDYLREDMHPSARRWDGLATAPADAPSMPEADDVADPRSSATVHPRPLTLAAGRERPTDSTPLYRTTLSQLCRFPTLAAFSAKDRPAGLAADFGAPTEDETVAAVPSKRYATGEQTIDCLGGSGKINVWNPFASATYQSTFSQQWYRAIQGGTLLQTVECGWHVDITRYGNDTPHFFVYTTRQNYNDGHSFYNLDNNVFRPVANPYVLPGAPLAFSQYDGSQVEYKMGFYLTGNAWWCYFDDHPIGSYPVSWFGTGPMATKATRAVFGGEAGTALSTWPPMGSGQHAAAGFRRAAYQRAVAINPTGGGAVHATLTDGGSVSGPCYSLQITNNSGSDWGSYLFFGGPGGSSC